MEINEELDNKQLGEIIETLMVHRAELSMTLSKIMGVLVGDLKEEDKLKEIYKISIDVFQKSFIKE